MDERTRAIEDEERFRITLGVLREEIPAGARVVEIGAEQASFRDLLDVADWSTVDKYGEPDVRADLDGSAAHLPWPDASVDVVVCTEVLEHLAAGGTLVQELARVLRPAGAAYVSVPNMVSLSCRIKWLLGRVPYMAAGGDLGPRLGATGLIVDGRGVAGHLVDFNRARLTGYLERGGLRVRRTYRMPLTLGTRIRIPARLTPRGLADFILVRAEKGTDLFSCSENRSVPLE